MSAELMGFEMSVEAQESTLSRLEAAKAVRQLEKMSKDLAKLKAERAAVVVAEERCAAYSRRLAAGDPGDPRAHMHHPDLPVPSAELRLGRIAAIWSAVSVGVLLLGVVVLAIFFPKTLIPGALLLLGVYVFIDASFHRSLESLTRSIVVALALLATIILVVQFFVPLLLLLVVFVGIFILVENVRELIA
jgi:uncharacterized membrane protein YccC